MKRPTLAARFPAVFVTWAAILILPTPAWANNPDYQQLRYLLFLWPGGALISLVLLALAVKAWRLHKPAPRLGWALILLSAAAILGWPYVVYVMVLGLVHHAWSDDLVAIGPPLVAALAGLVAGHRAKGGPIGEGQRSIDPGPPA